MLKIRGRHTRALVQGGMGVGVSAHRLAGAVAREGCVGTISSVDLRRLHPDLMLATGRSRDRQAIESANLVALDREIRAACEIAGGDSAFQREALYRAGSRAHPHEVSRLRFCRVARLVIAERA